MFLAPGPAVPKTTTANDRKESNLKQKISKRTKPEPRREIYKVFAVGRLKASAISIIVD